MWRRALIDWWVRQGWCQLRRAERHTKSLISLVALMSRLNRQRFRLAQRFRRDGPLAPRPIGRHSLPNPPVLMTLGREAGADVGGERFGGSGPGGGV